MKEFLQKCAEQATRAIEQARQRVADAQASLANAQTKMSGWQSKMSAYQEGLKKRSAEIERQKLNMVADCKSKCGKGNIYDHYITIGS